MDEDLDFEFEAAAPAPALVLGKKKKKKKPKTDSVAGASAPGADPDDGNGDSGEGVNVNASDASTALLPLLGKKKKKKKKKDADEAEEDEVNGIHEKEDDSGRGAKQPNDVPASAFAALNMADDDEDDISGDENEKIREEVQNGDLDDDADPAPDDEPQPVVQQPKGKKKKGKKGCKDADEDAEDIDAILADLRNENEANGKDGETETSVLNGQDDSQHTAATSTSSKKKGKKKKGGGGGAGEAAARQEEEDIDAILAELGETTQAKQTVGTAEKEKESAGVDTGGTGADLDSMMAELDGDAAGGASSAASKKKKKKKKGGAGAAAGGDDDIDALLAELDEPSPNPAGSQGAAAAASTATAKPEASEAPDASDNLDAVMAELDGPGETGPSASSKKKAAAKKKKKAAAAAAAALDGDAKTAEESTQAASGGKKGKKESAAVRRLREQQERIAAEEARLAKEREEEEQRRLEEERQQKEREEEEARRKQAKKEAEKARKERLRAEGKLLSKAEAARRRKAEAFRQQALASGLVPGATATAGSSGPQGVASGASNRVVYSKKKKNKGKPTGGVDDTDTSAAADQETEATGAAAEAKTEQIEGLKTGDAPQAQGTEPEAAPEPTKQIPPEMLADNWEDGELLVSGTDPAKSDTVESEAALKGNKDDADGAANGKGPISKAKQTGGTAISESAADDANPKDRTKGDDDVDDDDDDDDDNGDDDDDDDDIDDEDSEDEFDSEDSEYEGLSKTEIAALRRQDVIRRKRRKEATLAKARRTVDHLRSPIICILGHVDTGKTKILDRIRRTNVQDGEAGGITQQIGATYFPIDAVKKEAIKLEEGKTLDYNVPSLLIIDTPGHESFTNLRSRGSSLCDIAILVVDIMHGLEPQTRESIDLLKLRKTPFVVALNKIDRMYDWKAQPNNCPVRKALDKQKRHVVEEFRRRTRETQAEFQNIGFNTALYWENDDVRRTISLVPTSAITGEGMPDLLMLLLSLPQKLLTDRLMFSPILEATVLEVKVIEGLGTTIDIVLTGGTIREGDTIFVVGLDGPIQATIRALLTPHPMKEMRVKGQYLHHKEIQAAQGIKISAEGLEKAVAGTQLLVARDPTDEDEIGYLRDEVMKDFTTILQNVDKSGMGVYVQASTLGSLEALLEFLRTSKIPVSGINIGPVHKRDVTKASTMLEKQKEFATILAFDVPVEKEARELAEDVGVTIFTADIIYHLFDMFTEYMEKVKKERREEINDEVVFPSICKILQQHIFNKKDPIVLGVEVSQGMLRVGTPLVVKHGTEWLDIGKVISIELNQKPVIIAKRGESVAVKIGSSKTEHIMYGRHFTWEDDLVSKMSRPAINILKENFRDDLDTEDWRLVVKLKEMFQII